MRYLFYYCYIFDIDVVVYFAARCSSFMFLSFRKGSKVLQTTVCFHFMQFCHSVECYQVCQKSISFLFVFFLFSSMEPRFFKQQYVIILCIFILSRIFNQKILFWVFLPFNRITSKHVLPFCVYVIRHNRPKII